MHIVKESRMGFQEQSPEIHWLMFVFRCSSLEKKKGGKNSKKFHSAFPLPDGPPLEKINEVATLAPSDGGRWPTHICAVHVERQSAKAQE